MHKKIGLVLWILAAIVGGWYVYQSIDRPSIPNSPEIRDQSDGRVIESVAWKRFPAIAPFQLRERSGDEFDSSQLAGRPYLVSFFFASCPSICRDLNAQIKQLTEHFSDADVTFLSITVDPENDTPQVLSDYADLYDADPQRWLFLTGKMYAIQQIGRQQFDVLIDEDNHTGDILLVDRWGRFRDRFKWDHPKEMKRLKAALQQALAETQPPLDQSFETRNVSAGISHAKRPDIPWLNEFDLVDQDNQPFFSRDLTGQVWVASFFFTSCPGICPRQNEFIASIQDAIDRRGAAIVSITTDAMTDRPAVLREYARKIGAKEHWHWLTGDADYIRRVAGEFFRALSTAEHHSSELFVVDRWGNVRAKINWQQPEQKGVLLEVLEQLGAETQPPARIEFIDASTAESP